MSRVDIVFTCVGLYLAACVGVGLWSLRRTHDSRDFFLAGRRLGFFVTGIALFSTTASGFAFVGGPGLVYRLGMSSAWMLVSLVLGATLSAALVAKHLWRLAARPGVVSLPGALAERYQSEWTRGLSAVAILSGVIGYLATQILALSKVLQILLAESDLPIPLGAAVAIACAVLVFYCTTGGVIASVYTDVLQGAVMLVASVLVFIVALQSFDGGWSGITSTIANDDPAAMGPWGTLGIMTSLSWFLVFSLGSCGQPHVITKHMMFRRLEDLRRIVPLQISAGFLACLLWLGVGLVMRALVVSGQHPPLASADDAAPVFLFQYAPPVLAGVVFAGLFAAIMSTADAFLSIGAAALVHDLPCALGLRSHPSIASPHPRADLAFARLATVLLTAVAAVLAATSGSLIALLGASSWGLFAAALVPAVTVGLGWKRATARACNLSIATGLALVLGLRFGGVRLPFGFDPGAFGLLASMTVFLAVSLAAKEPPAPAEP